MLNLYKDAYIKVGVYHESLEGISLIYLMRLKQVLGMVDLNEKLCSILSCDQC